MGDGDVQSLQPEEVKLKMAAGDTFVLNVVTDWCPDCSMRQHPNLPGFVSRLAGAGLQVFQLTVQHQRLIFLSDDHEQMVENFGGHGYPRTILIVEGKEVESAVEVITKQDLAALAGHFISFLQDGA
jgi:thiol-disulfide isomerase/thioredoxin